MPIGITCTCYATPSATRAKRDWPATARDLKPVYNAPTEAAALDRLAGFSATWEAKYPAIVKLCENAWAEFTPFLSFDPEIPHGDLYDQRDRESECAVPPGSQDPWALPERAGRA
jgi:hypothetical protein